MEAPLTFTVHIRQSKAGRIVVGVLGRSQAHSRSSHTSSNAVSYCASTNTGIRWDNVGVAKVEVVVKLARKMAEFTLTDKNGKAYSCKVGGDILSYADSHFLPFIELSDAGDSVSWEIQTVSIKVELSLNIKMREYW